MPLGTKPSAQQNKTPQLPPKQAWCPDVHPVRGEKSLKITVVPELSPTEPRQGVQIPSQRGPIIPAIRSAGLLSRGQISTFNLSTSRPSPKYWSWLKKKKLKDHKTWDSMLWPYSIGGHTCAPTSPWRSAYAPPREQFKANSPTLEAADEVYHWLGKKFPPVFRLDYILRVNNIAGAGNTGDDDRFRLWILNI